MLIEDTIIRYICSHHFSKIRDKLVKLITYQYRNLMLGPINFVANLGVWLSSFWALASFTELDPVPKKSAKVNKSTIPRAPTRNLRSCTHGAWPVFEPGPSAMIGAAVFSKLLFREALLSVFSFNLISSVKKYCGFFYSIDRQQLTE